jgi:xanthosine utilization system XapX-like protein
VNNTARTEAETPQDAVPSDLQQAIESLIESRPSLADPAQLRHFNEAMSRQIAARHSRRDKIEIGWAKRMTSIATAFSGGATAALIAAVLVPAAPGLAIVGIGLFGLLVSKYVAAAIDSFMEKRSSASERSTM